VVHCICSPPLQRIINLFNFLVNPNGSLDSQGVSTMAAALAKNAADAGISSF
jgi:hypothetical protein